MFIATATAICSLGHRLHIFTAVTVPTSTQLCKRPSEVAKSSTSFGRGKGWNATSVGWQVTLCDLVRHVSSRSGEAGCILLCPVTLPQPRIRKQPSQTSALPLARVRVWVRARERQVSGGG